MAPGTNENMSGINTGFRFLQLRHAYGIPERRRETQSLYRQALSDGHGVTTLATRDQAIGNSAYLPMFANTDLEPTRDVIHQILRRVGIRRRRHFCPLTDEIPMHGKLASERGDMIPTAHRLSRQAIWLPLYPDPDDGYVPHIVESMVATLQ